MNPQFLIDRLAAGAPAIAALATSIPVALSAQRTDPDRWSVLEVLCHLRDEEREDFRVRIDATLHRPGEVWPGIDPPAWVTERDYAGSDPGEVLRDFLTERDASLRWLRDLAEPDWDTSYGHPLLGRLTAGDLLASWAAHDLLHLRQLTGAVFALVSRVAEPHGTRYAGEW
jgi:hypothetical protein